MGKTKDGTVKETGAPANSRLIGINPSNEELILYIHTEQKAEKAVES